MGPEAIKKAAVMAGLAPADSEQVQLAALSLILDRA